MKVGGIMPQKPRLIQMSLGGKIFLCVLAILYLGYLVAFVNFLHSSASTPSITEYPENANPGFWTTDKMLNAVNIDQQESNASGLSQGNIDINRGRAAQQQGQLPRSGETSYPLSTVGKVFFTSAAGQNSVCSGTAIVSSNQSVVDTAGHCLYWNSGWVQNLIFCPLYDNGVGPYSCWAARDLEVPSDWINRRPDDLHHDFGMAIVSPNSYGSLTDVVGGAGWAYNQPVNRPFYAYGYPAASPFDGQTRQSCENRPGKAWQEWGGTVVSIRCDMTGGSSGGPWFIQISGDLYLNGHNDFTTSMQRGHMFSPYYDDTWHALYDKAQYT
jgi:V8-like Glu-specific endopeptidase